MALNKNGMRLYTYLNIDLLRVLFKYFEYDIKCVLTIISIIKL